MSNARRPRYLVVKETSLWRESYDMPRMSVLFPVFRFCVAAYSDAANGLLNKEVYPILQSRNGDIWVVFCSALFTDRTKISVL